VENGVDKCLKKQSKITKKFQICTFSMSSLHTLQSLPNSLSYFIKILSFLMALSVQNEEIKIIFVVTAKYPSQNIASLKDEKSVKKD
jgi:hypothetical protein